MAPKGRPIRRAGMGVAALVQSLELRGDLRRPALHRSQWWWSCLFRKRLPHKVKALSKWKSVDIQRINPDEPDYRRISSYLGKQTNLELIALDPFNSDLSPQRK